MLGPCWKGGLGWEKEFGKMEVSRQENMVVVRDRAGEIRVLVT